jgi:hypothetical protein
MITWQEIQNIKTALRFLERLNLYPQVQKEMKKVIIAAEEERAQGINPNHRS